MEIGEVDAVVHGSGSACERPRILRFARDDDVWGDDKVVSQ